MQRKRITVADQAVLVAGVALAADLAVAPWHRLDLGPFGILTRTGIESPNATLGLAALAFAVLAAVATVVRVVTPSSLRPRVSPIVRLAVPAAAAGAAVAVAVKLVVERDGLGPGSLLAAALVLALLVGGVGTFRELTPTELDDNETTDT